jgi:hypothetical protein
MFPGIIEAGDGPKEKKKKKINPSWPCFHLMLPRSTSYASMPADGNGLSPE